VTTPDQQRVLRGLERDDLFTVVFDQVMTDTARYADVLLPATTFLEGYDLVKSYGPWMLGLVRPVIEPIGESRCNADVFGDLLDLTGLRQETDARGERRFLYWRDSAPARGLFDAPEAAEIVEALPSYDLLYFSGITLSLYGDTGRARFLEVLDRARQQGRRIAFDTNFRPRGWPDCAIAQSAYRAAFDRADMILASTEDLELLFGAEGVPELLSRRSSAELVLKLATPACRVISADRDEEVRAEPVASVVDTTAAGDSFAAAYIAARLSGVAPREAAYAGHRLAGAVVRHPGAIIPRAAMPSGILGPAQP